jgi:uncharacterized protein
MTATAYPRHRRHASRRIRRTAMPVLIAAAMLGMVCGCAHTTVSDTPGATTTAMAAPIHFYRAFLSRADGHRCPMTPSCSSYALAAMQRHGALMGYIMACDRLMRCGRDELAHSQKVMTRDGWRWQDPVGANDFWLD